LLEFSRARSQMRLVYGSLPKTIERAIQMIRTRAEFGRVQIALSCEVSGEAWFDPKKLERVFYNLILNACEAILPAAGKIEIGVREADNHFEIRISDNGPGIPGQIRGKLFQPFVSFGKENGTGLGLTVVQKILQDHGGEVTVERTSAECTVFKILLPIQRAPDPSAESAPSRVTRNG
jgi:signal transduction histidine kinase